MRLVARGAVTAVTVRLQPGELDLSPWLKAAAAGPGLLILDGAIVGYARVCDRVSAELLGRGDVVEPGRDSTEDRDEFVCSQLSWQALWPCHVAILDGSFAECVRPWPQIGQVLMSRVERRARDLAVARAITAQPRLDLRLVLMLWHLAPRWGRVERGGIRLPLPLTHHLLGRLVGAERPSVSHALKRLAAAGLIEVHEDGLHLRGTVEEHLSAVSDRADERVEELPHPRAGRGAA
jgi:CRP/FNR family cyclic AMP-dependent transcriptional regulator